MTLLLNLFEQKVLFFVIIADILAPIFRSCLDFIKNDYQIYYLKCNVVMSHPKICLHYFKHFLSISSVGHARQKI